MMDPGAVVVVVVEAEAGVQARMVKKPRTDIPRLMKLDATNQGKIWQRRETCRNYAFCGVRGT
jgi:hypothetical protein